MISETKIYWQVGNKVKIAQTAERKTLDGHYESKVQLRPVKNVPHPVSEVPETEQRLGGRRNHQQNNSKTLPRTEGYQLLE